MSVRICTHYCCAHVYASVSNKHTHHTKEHRVIDRTCVRNISREDPLRQTRGELPSQPSTSQAEYSRVLIWLGLGRRSKDKKMLFKYETLSPSFMKSDALKMNRCSDQCNLQSDYVEFKYSEILRLFGIFAAINYDQRKVCAFEMN